MSNIAGKAYAMNVITPIPWYLKCLNKFIFWYANKNKGSFIGLATLSLIHYARWLIIDRRQFPHLDESQPKEDLHYHYQLFNSNFNGSWAQYVDSFTFAIPSGLDLLWKWNVRYPRSVPMTPFHDYIRYNQVDTDHYYSAYPLATSNDIKNAKDVKEQLVAFDKAIANDNAETFLKKYHGLLNSLQNKLGYMEPTPIVSMAANAVEERRRQDNERSTK